LYEATLVSLVHYVYAKQNMALEPDTSEGSPEDSGQAQAVDTVQASDREVPEEDLGDTSDGEGLISVIEFYTWRIICKSLTDISFVL
tara:strand:- start:1274 stop:1534 length:261 start_codon:yes stop_codon:yes gene_type:complete